VILWGFFSWGAQNVKFFKNFCGWVMSQCNQGSPSFKKRKRKQRNTATLKCENLFIFPFGDAYVLFDFGSV
jgi:hypothetical protein